MASVKTCWDGDSRPTQKRLLEGLPVALEAEKAAPERADLPPMRRGWGFRLGPWAHETEYSEYIDSYAREPVPRQRISVSRRSHCPGKQAAKDGLQRPQQSPNDKIKRNRESEGEGETSDEVPTPDNGLRWHA